MKNDCLLLALGLLAWSATAAEAGIDAAVKVGGGPLPVAAARGLTAGSRVYSDSDAVYVDVPAWLEGADHVLQARADGAASPYVLTTTLDDFGTALLLVDDGLAPFDENPLLEWVEIGWHDTGRSVGVDVNADGEADLELSILARAIDTAGDLVTGTPGGSMYSVAFVEAEVDIPLRRFAPNGTLISGAWNVLILDTDSAGGALCDGGGTSRMQGNWTAPLDVATADPRAGDEWRIDFADAESTGWELTGLGPDPVWTSVSHTNRAVIDDARDRGVGRISRFSDREDVFDLGAFIDFHTDSLVTTPLGAGSPNDGVMASLTTYVRNTSGAPLRVGLCTASDDAAQVYVNNQRAVTVPICRALPEGCGEVRAWELPVGVSRITCQVWEGGGEFALRFGLAHRGRLLADGNGLVEFLGPGRPGDGLVGQDQDAPPAVAAGVNSTGSISSRGWNMLFLRNGHGARLGERTMNENWVAPHHIGREDPMALDVWDDIDFTVGSPSPGYSDGGIFNGMPTWFTLEALEGELGLIEGALGDTDAVDMTAIVETLNREVVGPGFTRLQGGAIPSGHALAILTTYFENTTDEALSIDVIHQTDDDAVLWLDSRVISRQAGCCPRRRAPTVSVSPGVHKLALLVWQGGGGWSARVELEIAGEGLPLTDADDRVRFLGAGTGDPAAVTSPDVLGVERRIDVVRGCDVTGPTRVTLQGVVAGAIGDGLDLDAPIRVEELVRNGTVGATSGLTSFPHVVEAPVIDALDEFIVMGTDSGVGGGFTGPDPDGVFSVTSTNGLDIQDDGDHAAFLFTEVTGDFDFAIEITGYEHSTGAGGWGKYGLMFRESTDRCARAGMAMNCGPGNPGDGGRAGILRARAGCGTGFSDGASVLAGNVVFQRVVRSGDVVRFFLSNDRGLADGQLDACDDSTWTAAGIYRIADWSETLLVGVANSEHGDGGVDVQTVSFRILDRGGPGGICSNRVGDGVEGKVTARQLLAGEVWYELEGSGLVELSGVQTERGFVDFTSEADGGGVAVGEFDVVQALGDGRGSLVLEGDGSYTLEMQGADIWNDGDHGFFAATLVEGDFRVTARVERPPVGVARWGKHGLMARTTCAPDATFSMASTTFREGDAAAPIRADTPRHRTRLIHGDVDSSQEERVVGRRGRDELSEQPEWIRLTRRGDFIFSEFADAGPGPEPRAFRYAGGDTAHRRTAGLLVGLAGTSHSTDAAVTVRVLDYELERSFVLPLVDSVLDGPPIFSSDFDSRIGKRPADSSLVLSDGLCDLDGTPNNGDELVFDPVVVDFDGRGDGRLQLSQDIVCGQNDLVLLDVDQVVGAGLADTGFEANFDVFFQKLGVPGLDANPGDGLVFAVYEGSFRRGVANGSIFTLLGGAGPAVAFDRGDQNARPPRKRSSFAIEFDPWSNAGSDGNGATWGDPYGHGSNHAGAPFDGQYHVGIDVNQDAQSIQTNVDFGVARLPDIYDPDGVRSRVRYTPQDGRIRVWLTGLDRADEPVPETLVLDAIGPRMSGNVIIGLGAGSGDASLTAFVDNLEITPLRVGEEPRGVPFVRGDINADGGLNLSDGVKVLNVLFLGVGELSCQAAADTNADGAINLSDGINVFNVLFLGTGAIPPPLACDEKPLAQQEACERFSPCQ